MPTGFRDSILTIVWVIPLVSLTEQLKNHAYQLGFVLGGVTLAAAPQRLQQFHAWLDAGYAGQMRYLTERRLAYAHPRHVLDGCRSILMLALPYAPLTFSKRNHNSSVKQNAPLDQDNVLSQERILAKVAKYAQGEIDYHDVIHDRLQELKAWLLQRHPQAAVRGVVDTAPLLERELAEAAGLGWIGKNTLLLNREWGSNFFLAALLTDLELQPDEPYEQGYCGTCTACLDACPTNAFPEPYILDANKCISYLTIEHREAIEPDLRRRLDGWIFGCDVCQEVCPWNQHSGKRRTDTTIEPEFQPRDDLLHMDLLGVLELSDEQFRQRFRQTPLWRAKRRGLLRNAILLAGTRRLPGARNTLQRLSHDTEPLIQQAAQWALQQYEF